MEQETQTLVGSTPPAFMVFALAGILVISAITAWYVLRRKRDGEPIRVGAIAWPVLFAGILAFLATWCTMGLVDSEELTWVQCIVVLTLGGSLTALRERSFQALHALDQTPSKHVLSQVLRLLRDATLLFVASELARISLERSWNDALFSIGATHVSIELSFVALAVFIGYFVTQRHAVGPAIVVVACTAIGLAQYFVIQFRDAAILPMDVLAITTAAEVSNQYTYLLGKSAILGIMYAGLALTAISFIRPAKPRDVRALLTNASWNLGLTLVLALALNWWIVAPNYRDDFDLNVNYWMAHESYRVQGFLPTFMVGVQDMPVKRPEGYSTELAESITAKYAAQADAMPERAERRKEAEKQFKELEPSVIVIMNETFADLSRLDQLHCDYMGPQFFQSIDDTLSRGQLGLSVYGAGTCNSEFEVLTGDSLSFVGSAKYPYQMFSFENISNLARQFKGIGYHTTAMHPANKTNWNREKTYEGMGFDDFLNLTDGDFDGKPGLHFGTTDRGDYEVLLDVLEKNEGPQFIHNVTLQNHGGYDGNTIPADRMTDYAPEGFDEAALHRLNTYLSLIQASDEDLEWFIGQLRELDRPVVLIFFGDHHPSISNAFNDAFFPDEDELTHMARVHQTEYIVWANYDVAGCAQDSPVEDVGSGYLGTMALDLIGAPLDDFQKAQIAAHRRLPIVSGLGYKGTDGRWHAPHTEPYLDTTYRDMEMMDYLHFGSKVSDAEKEDA